MMLKNVSTRPALNRAVSKPAAAQKCIVRAAAVDVEASKKASAPGSTMLACVRFEDSTQNLADMAVKDA